MDNLEDLPLASREWKNGSNSSYNCTPFLHSLLTKGKTKVVKGALPSCPAQPCLNLNNDQQDLNPKSHKP